MYNDFLIAFFTTQFVGPPIHVYVLKTEKIKLFSEKSEKTLLTASFLWKQ